MGGDGKTMQLCGYFKKWNPRPIASEIRIHTYYLKTNFGGFGGHMMNLHI